MSLNWLHPETDRNRCGDTQAIIRVTSGNPVEEVRKICFQWSQRNHKQTHKNQLTWIYRGSQSLNQWPGSLHETNLGPLHTCYNYATWSSCETSISENRDYYWLFCLLLGPTSPSGLPCPGFIEEKMPSFSVTWCTMAYWYPWDAHQYLKRNWEGGEDGRGGEDNWQRGTGSSGGNVN